jgi:hypothetical protein
MEQKNMRARALPGPWRIEDGRILGPTKDSGWAPVIGQVNQGTEIERANGLLICAAPELLNACVEVNRLIGSGKAIGPSERFWILTKLLHVSILATEATRPRHSPGLMK